MLHFCLLLRSEHPQVTEYIEAYMYDRCLWVILELMDAGSLTNLLQVGLRMCVYIYTFIYIYTYMYVYVQVYYYKTIYIYMWIYLRVYYYKTTLPGARWGAARRTDWLFSRAPVGRRDRH